MYLLVCFCSVELISVCFLFCFQIEKRLHAAGKSHLFTRLSYPGAGHLIEPPYAPNARVSLWTTRPAKRMSLTHQSASCTLSLDVCPSVMTTLHIM